MVILSPARMLSEQELQDAVNRAGLTPEIFEHIRLALADKDETAHALEAAHIGYYLGAILIIGRWAGLSHLGSNLRGKPKQRRVGLRRYSGFGVIGVFVYLVEGGWAALGTLWFYCCPHPVSTAFSTLDYFSYS